MAGQHQHMAGAVGIALLVHVAGYAYWATLPPPASTVGTGSVRFALAGDIRPPETDAAPVTESVAEIPPAIEPAPAQPVEPEVVQVETPPPLPELPVRRRENSAPASSASTKPAPASASPATALVDQVPGSVTGKTGPGAAEIENAYKAIVSDWIARHKRYPRAAARRGLEGRGEVTFIVTRAGNITQLEISGSTGFAVLDRELKAMLERASPLPSFPASIPQAQLEIKLPVRFDHQS
ncbi:MAG: TonB family protein [Parvibaculum sp.]